MKAMILAAGYGTRFRPVTHAIPKPMIPVCNRPLIAYAIDALLEFGATEIVINLHHLPEQIEHFVTREYGTRCGFAFSFEKEILGTGGGVRRARRHFNDAPFILVNGDTIQAPPFPALSAVREREKAIAALALRHPPPNDRFTPVYYERNLVTGIGTGQGEALMFSGAHVLSPEIFSLLPDREFSGIVEDVYAPLLQSGERRIAAVVDDGYWFDIGTPARYLTASLGIARLMRGGRIALAAHSQVVGDSITDDRADVQTALHESIVGAESSIAGTSTVTRSVIWKRASIGNSSSITDSIIGDDVVVPAGTAVENALLWSGDRQQELPDGAARVDERTIAVPVDASREMIVRRGS